MPVRVTAGFISRVFMFYDWRIVYSTYVLFTTLFILNYVLRDLIGFYDLPALYMSLIVFCIFLSYWKRAICNTPACMGGCMDE